MVRAAYDWVITNIRYDEDSARIINAGSDPNARVDVAFKRRKGVCENFAAIFNDICNKAGLHSVIINGYTKQNGQVDKAGHVWCAVSIDKEWYLFDPTWDVGNTKAPRYFMGSGDHFAGSHMPFDPIWQLSEQPITHEQFYKGNKFTTGTASAYMFKDSINAYLGMDSLQKVKSELQRIEKMGLYNKRIREHHALLKSLAEMNYQDEQVDYYNAAVADLNEATSMINKFINWRNDTASNQLSPGALQQLIDGANAYMLAAAAKLDVVDRSPAVLVFGTTQAREKLQALMLKTDDQQLYLKSAYPDR